MFNKYAWKQPIFKSDLVPVLINGLIAAILGGILGGLVDYLSQLIGLNISFGLLILCYFIGNRVRKSYYSYHILYPTLTILFMILGLLFSTIAVNFIAFRNIQVVLQLFKPMVLLNIIVAPIKIIISSIISFNILVLLMSLFNLAMYVIAFMYAYRLAKGRN